MRKFFQFTPSVTDTYKKPSNASLKALPEKRLEETRMRQNYFRNALLYLQEKV